LDANLIERLARLRGIGDFYHDYRGELRYFTLQTKTDILRAMGCAVDDPAALAAEVSRLTIERGRALLPAIAAAPSWTVPHAETARPATTSTAAARTEVRTRGARSRSTRGHATPSRPLCFLVTPGSSSC